MSGLFKKIVIALSLAYFLLPVAARADVVAYSAPGDKHVFIEAAPQLGEKTYVIEFSGVDSSWAGKPIKTEKTSTHSGDRYAFEYEVHLSSGTIKRTYQIVLDSDPTLINGSIVPTVELYYKGGSRDGIEFAQDVSLTKSSQNLGLAQQYQSTPYQPDMQ